MLDDADDVGCVAAARALRVVRVDGAPAEGRHGALNEARLVERVRVNQALHVQLVAYAQARVDGRWRRAPVFVQLEPTGAGYHLLAQGLRCAVVALARDAHVERQLVAGLQHLPHVCRPRCARRRRRPRTAFLDVRSILGHGDIHIGRVEMERGRRADRTWDRCRLLAS